MKQLEDILNLAPAEADDDIEEYVEVDTEKAKHDIEEYQKASGNADHIDAALPPVDGLDEHAREMDSLAKKAEEAYDDLINLGMNVDTRSSGRIFEIAASMLGHSISAKNSKIDKKLKMLDLQLKKQKQDRDAGIDDDTIKSSGEVVDRNEFLRELLANKKDEQ